MIAAGCGKFRLDTKPSSEPLQTYVDRPAHSRGSEGAARVISPDHFHMTISTEDLERARTLAARIVAEFGERFLPLFEVLDADYVRRQSLSEKIDRAQKISAFAKQGGPRLNPRTGCLVQGARSSSVHRADNSAIRHPRNWGGHACAPSGGSAERNRIWLPESTSPWNAETNR